jgi:hypothetical protein
MHEKERMIKHMRNTYTFVSQLDVTRKDFVFVWRGFVAGPVMERGVIPRTSHVVGLIMGVIADVPAVDETGRSAESTDVMMKWDTIQFQTNCHRK